MVQEAAATTVGTLMQALSGRTEPQRQEVVTKVLKRIEEAVAANPSDYGRGTCTMHVLVKKL